jgi:hypothetical protein
MPDTITELFDRLGRRGYEPFWARIVGTVRIELVEAGRTDTWVVAIDTGACQCHTATTSASAGCGCRGSCSSS